MANTTSTGTNPTTYVVCQCYTGGGIAACPLHSWAAMPQTYTVPGTITIPTTSPIVWPLPFHVEEVEIDDVGIISVYGANRLLLGTVSAKAIRRLVDVGVLDGFR